MLEQEASSISQDENVQISTFYLNDTLCGIDIDLVQEINGDLAFTPVPLADDFVLGIMNLRGQIVTVIDQGMKIGFPPFKKTGESRVIIVRSGNEHIGVVVDKVKEVVTVSRKTISKPPSNIKGSQGKFFKGVIQTEKHELLALLDIDEIL
ncbi:MAG: chemotaxis protein CheW [Proteobacteria bacterium]|nr:chemotaxis protein CheW [Desulfobulbaceae bacterium]MBU4154319.1 chemotaxis protein CheW [Pseudomonadota bacterium]MDP2105262.1 chemotaxis protein CheW [Desulfobulbaceae bacterium]